jgi:hypothetical protein
VFAGCDQLRYRERRVEPAAAVNASADISRTGAVGHRHENSSERFEPMRAWETLNFARGGTLGC